ncbi:MAG TPA: AlgP family protein, partial [Candidatus Dormibacteraeota bacterium]|nr:AlgP family protein [Candidatus Dormibacteraeota bacterium]
PPAEPDRPKRTRTATTAKPSAEKATAPRAAVRPRTAAAPKAKTETTKPPAKKPATPRTKKTDA